MGRLGWMEIAIIILLVMLFFGGRKIPELMRGLGSGIKEFKKASSATDDDESKPTTPTT
ncbi:MAG: hypothetical protein RL594_441 [Bacteroidota bacterium]|jgi:sec-independent protein translocase protein TatA